jgi:hypothetical protein
MDGIGDIILNEISQVHKDKYHMFSFIYKIYGEKNKTINVKGVVPGIWK